MADGTTQHPLVRVHPVTGEKALYVNQGFTRRIVGVPKAESDAVLQLLFRQIRCAARAPARPPLTRRAQREPGLPGALPLDAERDRLLGQQGACPPAPRAHADKRARTRRS